ncbi:MAG: thiamine-phosphate kinase [Thermodesulfobacteriota bacterium]|nr:thiamine-phosphate kinase [Thermodesulfobacteriota bacterium]
MLPEILKEKLRFYFITDDSSPLAVDRQVQTAICGGATMIQYRHKSFTPAQYGEVLEIRKICRANNVPLIINDDIVMAKAVGADGVHLGQADASPAIAREVLGNETVVGVSVSTTAELAKTDIAACDYIGTGPVFATATKKDSKPVIAIDGLRAVVEQSKKPVVAIGGITADKAPACLETGACGVAVISWVSRAEDPESSARKLATACGIKNQPMELRHPWSDEFGLIRSFLNMDSVKAASPEDWVVPPGHDAAVLRCIDRPVFTTDAHVEGVHFDFSWQTPAEVGAKAAIVTLSDLAAACAEPVAMFVNLTLPDNVSEYMITEIYQGLDKALAMYGCALGGGNISGGPCVALDMFAVGKMPDIKPPLRSAARPGDGLYSTGRLGLARAGLLSLQAKETEGRDLFIERFKRPRARFDAARVLAGNKVACVMDISDGLTGDARHIAEASNVTIVFDLDAALITGALLDFCRGDRAESASLVLRGGEDYELLFTCPENKATVIRQALPDVYRVGHCRTFTGSYLEGSSSLSSFQHGGGRGADNAG